MKNLILKYVSRNLDTLIDFLNGLDDQLDLYIKKQEAEANTIDLQISSLEADRQAKVRSIATAQNLRSGVRGVTNVK